MLKNKHAQEMNRLRNLSLTKKRRSEIGKKAVKARWDKARDLTKIDAVV